MTTLAFPASTPMVFIAGQHWQDGGEIVGRFERDELEVCLLIADIWTEDRERVQGRLGDERATGER